MPRQSSDGTRLPPKATLVKKQSGSRFSKKAQKALVEKETMMKEELVLKLEEQSQSLEELLKAGGVPKELCIDITEELSSCSQLEDGAKRLDQGSNAIARALSYGECYPAINISQLIPVLNEVQSVIVDLSHLAYRPGKRNIEPFFQCF